MHLVITSNFCKCISGKLCYKVKKNYWCITWSSEWFICYVNYFHEWSTGVLHWVMPLSTSIKDVCLVYCVLKEVNKRGIGAHFICIYRMTSSYNGYHLDTYYSFLSVRNVPNHSHTSYHIWFQSKLKCSIMNNPYCSHHCN